MVLGITNMSLLNRNDIFVVENHYSQWQTYFNWIEDCIDAKIKTENIIVRDNLKKEIKIPDHLESEHHRAYQSYQISEFGKNYLQAEVNYPNFQRTSAFLLLFTDFEYQVKECFDHLFEGFSEFKGEKVDRKNVASILYWLLKVLDKKSKNFPFQQQKDFTNRIRILRNTLIHQFGSISESFEVNNKGELVVFDINNRNILSVIRDLTLVSIKGRLTDNSCAKSTPEEGSQEDNLYIELEKGFLKDIVNKMESFMKILVEFTVSNRSC